ncbi:ROK family glucokinase [Konateibacter massiliensis]|uniref:ROK family glucokinase n=1 Tax=Konateibacter massiliensis TaxID=2002841 RepID=UPI000C155BDD|nr:ROK family glucokinase [Konateibacter massiliensis]
MEQYAFGIDIGGTTIKCGLFETTGQLVDKWEIPTRKENDGSYILEDIAETIAFKMERRKIDKTNVAGIGVGVPGPVLKDGTVVKCVNLGWDVINVAKELEKKTGLLVKVQNDANVAALGEMWQGGGKGYQNLVMVTLGTGVGGGIIIEGKVLGGADGAGGEIGHINMRQDETEYCGCKSKGCLEQYASATGVVHLAREELSANRLETVLKNDENLSAELIFNVAKAGDKLALLIADKTASYLGRGLAQIGCIVNPEIFVIGGGMAKAGDILLDAVKKHYSKNVFHAAANTEFAFAQLGNDAGMYGSVQLLLGDRV